MILYPGSFYNFLNGGDFSKPAIKLFLMSLFSEQNFLDKMYSVFKKNGILAPETGRRFRKVIFEPGGTVHPKFLIQEFLGREPNMDAFLTSLGIQPN